MTTAPLAGGDNRAELTLVRHPPASGGQRRGGRTGAVIILSLVAAVMVVTVTGLLRQRAVPVPPFVVTPVTRGEMRPVVRGWARAEPWLLARVSPAIAGRVERVGVQVGDYVSAGDVLATLERRSLRLAVRRADAWLAVAEAKAAERQVTLVRAMEDLDIYSEPGETLADSEVAATVAYARQAAAQAEVAARQVTLDLAAAQLRAATLRATAPGIVAAILTEPGATVSPDKPAFIITETAQRLRAVVVVGDADIKHVHVGQAATVVTPAFPGRTFRARVASIPLLSEANWVSAGIPVTLWIDNPTADLLSGMSVMATIEGPGVSNVLRVPEAALQFVPPGAAPADSLAPAIWTLRSGEPVRVPVVVGVRDGALVEVRGEALAEGAPVVVDYRAGRR